MPEQHSEAAREAGAEDTGAASVVAPAKALPRPKTLPQYRVLLHNDDVNDMLHVVDVVFRLTPLTVEEAVARMLEAHHTGVALLLVTHRERAELYAEQFATFKLTVTIEPEA